MFCLFLGLFRGVRLSFLESVGPWRMDNDQCGLHTCARGQAMRDACVQ